MARAKRKLSFDKATGRWKKFFQGKRYYLGYGSSKNDDASYRQAMEKWEKLKAELENYPDTSKEHYDHYQSAIEMREAMAKWCLLNGPEYAETHDKLVGEIDKLKRLFARAKPPALNKPDTLSVCPLTGMTASEKMEWFDRVEMVKQYQQWTEPKDKEKSMVNAIDAYLEARKARAESGQMAISSVGVEIEKIKPFREFCQGLSVDEFNGQHITGYKQVILSRHKEGRYAQWTTKHYLKIVRECIQWLWENEVLDHLPRNLKELRFKVDITEPEPIPIDLVKQVLNGPDGRVKLYVLLMLNCGMYQIDIANLKPEEVNWDEGRIDRKRSKTSKFANVPKVNYRLWKKTLDLLKQYGNQQGERVLSNENGLALVRRWIDDNGKPQDVDNVINAYKRYCEKLGINPIPALKRYRKTSASLLFNHKVDEIYPFKSLYKLFLDHTATDIGERHYVRPDKDTLDKAILWLGEQYGIE